MDTDDWHLERFILPRIPQLWQTVHQEQDQSFNMCDGQGHFCLLVYESQNRLRHIKDAQCNPPHQNQNDQFGGQASAKVSFNTVVKETGGQRSWEDPVDVTIRTVGHPKHTAFQFITNCGCINSGWHVHENRSLLYWYPN